MIEAREQYSSMAMRNLGKCDQESRLLGSLSGFVPVSVNTGLLARPVKDNVSNETDKHGP